MSVARAAAEPAGTANSELRLEGGVGVPARREYDRRSVARWVASHLWPYRLLIACTVVGFAFAVTCRSAIPLVLGDMANVMLDSAAPLDRHALALVALAVFGELGSFLAAASAENIARRFQADARHELYESLLAKSQAFHDRQRIGDMVARATDDTVQLSLMIIPNASLIIESALSIAIPLFAFANIRLELLAGPSLFVVALGFALRDHMRRLDPVMAAQRESIGRLNDVLSETIAAVELVKTHGSERRERAKYLTHASALRESSIAQGRIEARYLPIFLYSVALGGVLLHAFSMHSRDLIDLSGVVAAVGIMGVLRLPTFLSISTFTGIASGVASARRILGTIAASEPSSTLLGGHDAPVRGDIDFEDVGLGRDGHEVLRGISFRLRTGETLAIVGQTGSGKTSLAQLINRTHEPTSGSVRVDGIDLNAWNQHALRSQIGSIEQDVFLFSRSIAENIAFGRPGASRREVEAAACDAHAHEFISSLPRGYDTVIGARGMTLSGGQRQRLAIARAFLNDPRILILDDSTSALDSSTEAAVQAALRRIRRGRTTLLITHRLAQIRDADQILVLERGEQVALGNHDELMRDSPQYQRLFTTANRLRPGKDTAAREKSVDFTS